jgi:hypothetical protein
VSEDPRGQLAAGRRRQRAGPGHDQVLGHWGVSGGVQP